MVFGGGNPLNAGDVNADVAEQIAAVVAAPLQAAVNAAVPPPSLSTPPPKYGKVTSPADFRKLPPPSKTYTSGTSEQGNDLTITWGYTFSPVTLGFPSNAWYQRTEADTSGTGYATLGIYIRTGKNTVRLYVYNIYNDVLYPLNPPYQDLDISDSGFLTATRVGVQLAGAAFGGAYLAYFQQASSVAQGQTTVGQLATNYAKSQLTQGATEGLQEGLTTMFDSDTFDGWNFSSGEGDVAFSDAQNVDYGFGGSFDAGDYDFDWSNIDTAAGLGGVSEDLLNSSPEIYEFNATPEVTTNDFGTIFDNVFGDIDFNTAVKGVKVAQQAAGAVKAVTGKSASSGASGAKATAGVGDILSSMGKVFSAVGGAVTGTVAGTASQKTTAQPVRYNGQLTPTGGAVLGMSTGTILLAGAALIGLAFLVKKG